VDTKPESGKRAGLLDGYISEADLAADLDNDVRTLQRWRKLGIGPPFVMKGITPLYNLEKARQWLANGGTAGAVNNKPSRRRRA
jgi:hypothetical protein